MFYGSEVRVESVNVEELGLYLSVSLKEDDLMEAGILPHLLARDKGYFHAPGENRTCDPASFCQQVDDWTLLKITEKIIQRNVFSKRKRNPG